jgi:hypothetical protein
MFLDTKELLKAAHFSYFQPVMTYDITFWGNSYDSNKIFLQQKKVIGIMAGAQKRIM